MTKKISQFKIGDVITFMESGWNQVVAYVADKDPHGVSLIATSLTFGAQDTDGLFLPNDFLVTKWQSPIPEILK